MRERESLIDGIRVMTFFTLLVCLRPVCVMPTVILPHCLFLSEITLAHYVSNWSLEK